MIDDRGAYRCALAVGVPVIGTLALVIQAKLRGMIPSARLVLEELRRSGWYLSDRWIIAALELAGEQ